MPRIWTVDRIMRLMMFAAVFVVIVGTAYYLRNVLFPFFAAFLLAYIVDPLVNRLQVKVKHRIVAVLIVIFGGALILTGCMLIFVPKVVNEVQYLGSLLVRMFNDSAWSERISSYIPTNIWEFVKESAGWEKIGAALQHFDSWESIGGLISKILPGAWGVVSKTVTIIFGFSTFALMFLYLIFIMVDMPKLRSGVASLIPKRYQADAFEMAHEVDRFMGNYFRAQSIVALSVGVLYAIGFSIMGLPMGIVFGLFSGALNMVPYLQLTSIPLALVLSVVYSLDSGMPLWQVAIIVLFIYLVVQIIQDLFLVPHIVGKSMNLPPVGILLSLSIWGKLLGFLGLLVAVPFTCLCLVFIRKVQKKSEAMHAESVGPNPEA
ncbi:MAG: AI-2E family transporter [Fibrobacter sp.]|nr:AI-2E family transporter [Fibrobacter sp.]